LYTSGAQLCKGAAPILNKNPIIINNSPNSTAFLDKNICFFTEVIDNISCNVSKLK
jgi:hypothetical protein